MSTILGNRMPPKVGNDYHLYFNFNLGAEWKLRADDGAEFTVKITSCNYVNGVEYYTYSQDGEDIPGRVSANRFDWILRYRAKVIHAIDRGVATELPILDEEIDAYYSYLRSFIHTAQQKALRTVEGTQYNVLENKIHSYSYPLAMSEIQAELSGDYSEVDRLRRELDELHLKKQQLLRILGVSESELRGGYYCGKCKDTGYDLESGKRCACIARNEMEIKHYSAQLRANN